MELLDNPVHRDAWGSLTAIPELLGEDPDGEPRSELWLGAHPSSSSTLHGSGSSLAELIVADPAGTLGREVVAAYGPRLPFLLKVLAAERPLSLQAHPSPAQAAAGFADEERRGIALDDESRNYSDPSHKPELICALTEFHALCGFRPVDESVALPDRLGIDALAADADMLRTHPDAGSVHAVLTRLLHLSPAARAPLVRDVAQRCAAIATEGGADVELAQTVVELAERYPADVGVVCAVLMNRVTLQPGEAIFLGAGNLHAYLRGVGVELMASSDNVLRGGLTTRHVDVEELLAILDTTPGPVPMVTPVVHDVATSYPTPVPDFALTRVALRAGQSYELPPGRPRILLVVDGALEVEQAGASLELTRGQAGFFAAGDPPAVLNGPATAFLATTSTPQPGETPPAGQAG